MRERFIKVTGTAQAETKKAFLFKPCVLELDGATRQYTELWIPKAHIHDDHLDLDDMVIGAIKGDDITLDVADWWIRQET